MMPSVLALMILMLMLILMLILMLGSNLKHLKSPEHMRYIR